MKKDGIEVAYTYDALDRLVKTNSLHTNESYEYDKRGNLIGVTDRGKKIKAYEYGASGRLGLSYSNLGNARSYDYDGMGNRIGCREYKFESKGLGEDRLKSINELDLAKKEPVYEERYVLDRTRPYNNMLQRSILDRGKEQTQSYSWDFNAVFMEEEEKVYTYLNNELGSTIRLLEKEGKSQTIYGYDEFGKDTYGTQGQVQPFGYTGYRYDAVADTYFAQAREYVAGVGRFGGEDWIKGSIGYPTSLNAYGYCYGNPLVWVDRDGKATGAYSLDVKESPYVGVFYLNEVSGALGNGHVALMLVHEDKTGDLYSFIGSMEGLQFITTVGGYNDAYVNCGYGLDLNSILSEKKDQYEFTVNNRSNLTHVEKYDRGIYIPIDNAQGRAIVKSVESTKLEVNGYGYDIRDYNVFRNNCDIKARKWLKAGGIEIFKDDMMPNATYMNTVDDIRNGKIKGYTNIKYGDLYDVWTRIQKECLSSE